MKPLTFLGRTFTVDEDFKRAYPAYGEYVAIVRAGADTPHKVEIELHRKSSRRSGAPRKGNVNRKRKAA